MEALLAVSFEQSSTSGTTLTLSKHINSMTADLQFQLGYVAVISTMVRGRAIQGALFSTCRPWSGPKLTEDSRLPPVARASAMGHRGRLLAKSGQNEFL